MAYLSDANFDARSKRILKNAKIAKRGRITFIKDDGLIVARPHRGHRQLPVVGLARILLGLWIFKALAVFNLGAADYDERIALLQDGNIVDRLAAFALQSDAPTLAAVETLDRAISLLSMLELAAIF